MVRRYRAGRAHGSYTTIVEEILARAYIDKIGGVVWQQMKKDTADSFTDPATSAGAALLAEIASQQAAGNKKFKRIILVGHSTGAVFISNLIDASARLLPDASFDVVLLAPAVTYKKLAATLNNHGARIHKIRRFGMRDEVEVEDVLVPIVYPRSLLYFVSGLLEFSDDEPTERVADTPLVGMQRFSVNRDVHRTGPSGYRGGRKIHRQPHGVDLVGHGSRGAGRPKERFAQARGFR